MSVRSTVQRLDYKGSDHVYYDIAIRNTTDRLIPATFKNSSPSIVLENPSDYYIAVAQFDLPNRGLPIFLLRSQEYRIAIQGFGYHETYLWPFDDPTPDPLRQRVEKIYSYQRVIDLINKAISRLWTLVVAASGGVLSQADKPIMILDTQTKVASLCYPVDNFDAYFDTGSYINGYGNLPAVSMIFYDKLYNLFPSLPAQKFIDDFGASANFLLAYRFGGNANIEPINDPADEYVVMRQEYPTLSMWRDYLSVAFVGLGLPIRNEYYPAIAQTFAEATDNTRNTNIQPILFDFVPDGSVVGQGAFVYQEPQGQYRFVDLSDNMPLSRFSIQCQIRYENNQMDDLQLFPGETARLKLVFVRKGAGSQTFKSLADGGQLQIIQQATSLAQNGIRLV